MRVNLTRRKLERDEIAAGHMLLVNDPHVVGAMAACGGPPGVRCVIVPVTVVAWFVRTPPPTTMLTCPAPAPAAGMLALGGFNSGMPLATSKTATPTLFPVGTIGRPKAPNWAGEALIACWLAVSPYTLAVDE